MAGQVKALLAQNGGSYALAGNAHAWLAGLADPTGAARKNADLWNKDPDVPAADFATGNIYALAWLLAQGDDIVPIPGFKRVETLRDSAGAPDVTLTSADLATIEAAAPSGQTAGPRYHKASMAGVKI